MKDEFIAYLGSIGMSTVLVERAQSIYDFYGRICREDITDIFVSEFIKQDGDREYQSLWFFSQGYAMEAKEFSGKDAFDMARIDPLVIYWIVEKQDYDFQAASDKSRLHIRVTLQSMQGCDFKASKNNCDYLKGLFLKYFAPRL
jgi:hypothetical protein